MELNLRKARKLESKIENLVNQLKNNLQLNDSVRVNADVQSEIIPQLVRARDEFFASFENIQSLINARFEIRGLIAIENELSGVNKAILEKVTLENKVSVINSLLRSFSTLDQKELEDSSEVHKKALANSERYARVTFESDFLSTKDESDFKIKQVKYNREIEALEDKLLAFNYSVKIKLSNEIVTLLQANSLL